VRNSVAAAAAVLLAATAGAADFDLGVKAGVNLATLSGGGLVGGDVSDELERRTGLVLGAYARFPLGQVLAVQPELLYSQKGFRLDAFGVDVTGELDALELAVPLRVDFLEDGAVRPFLLAGPYLGIEMSSEVSVGALGVDVDQDIGDEVKDTDFGLLAGAGLRFPLGSLSLDLEARYAWVLTGLSELPGDDVKHRVLSILAGVAF
jgi:opacity protein-like surface antigen